MENNAAFWDKNYSQDEVKKILNDEGNPKFIEVAATLLSRFNKPGEVFESYLDKVMFCNNWRKIKKQMRKNKWSDARIIFWDEVYKVALQDIDKNELRRSKKRDIDTDPEMKGIGDVIRAARKKRGWIQAELAKRSKLSQQTISFVEKGYTNISVKTLKKIIDTLGLRFAIEYPQQSITSQTYSA
jgi:HTH-type transcriptional regulator/antitoxin HipB